MSQVFPLTQDSFSGGEMAPQLRGRVKIDKYFSSCRTMRNWFCSVMGETMNRGGTEYIGANYNASYKSKLTPFQFSTTDSYVIEWNHLFMRVLRDGGIVLQQPTRGTDIVVAATYKWTASGSGTNEYYVELLAGGDPSLNEPGAVYEDVGGANTTMTEGTLGSLSAGEWGYGDNDSLGYSTIYVRLTDNVDPDTKADGYMEAAYIHATASPYNASDLPLLKIEQSADTMYLTHPSYAVRKLTRTDHDQWTFTAVTFAASISAPTNFARTVGSGVTRTYTATAISSATGDESGGASSAVADPGDTVGWTAVSGAEYYNVYEIVNNVPQYIGRTTSTSFGIPSSYTADPDVTTPTANNPFNASDDYPGCSGFHEQRIFYARTNNNPQTFWASVTGSFDNMNYSIPGLDDDSLEFTLNTTKVNEVRWILSLSELIIGTGGGVFKINGGESSVAITATAINSKRQSSLTASHHFPIVSSNSILFIEGSEKKIRALTYSLELDSYADSDLSILSEHLFNSSSIYEWTYELYPYGIIWMVRDDGTLVGLTYSQEHKTYGFHRHDTGASGLFESVASITTNEGVSETYVSVKRTINGSDVRYLEILKERLPDDTLEDAWILDCALEYNGADTNNITDLEHLEGETVNVLANGVVLEGLTISSGACALGATYSAPILLGIPITGEMEQNDLSTPPGNESIQDKHRTVKTALIKYRNSCHALVGTDSANVNEAFEDNTTLQSESIESSVGDQANPYEARVYVKTTKPLPCTIQSIMARVEISGD